MPVFRYKAVAPSGEIVEGRIEAPDRAAAVDRLHAGGQYPLSAEDIAANEPVPAGRRTFVDFFAFNRLSRPSRAELALFVRELATLVGAGLAVDHALRVLADLSRPPGLRALAQRLANAVRSGEELSRAAAREAPIFAPLHVAMIAAGEAGGGLDAALARLARVLERSRETEEALSAALLYPAVVAAVAVVSAVFLLGFVIPRFEAVLSGLGRDLPLATAAVIALARFVESYGWLLVLALAGAAATARWRLNDPAFRHRFDRVLLDLRVVGPLILRIEAERFARALSALVDGGVALPNALAAAADVAANRAFAVAIGGAAVKLREGQSLAASLLAAGVFPTVLVEMARLGEETGRLAPMLAKAADIFEGEVKAATQRLVALVTPAAVILLGVLIAGLMLTLFGAVFAVYDLGGAG